MNMIAETHRVRDDREHSRDRTYRGANGYSHLISLPCVAASKLDRNCTFPTCDAEAACVVSESDSLMSVLITEIDPCQ